MNESDFAIDHTIGSLTFLSIRCILLLCFYHRKVSAVMLLLQLLKLSGISKLHLFMEFY